MAELVGWPTDGAEGSVSSEARWRKMARLWAPSGVANGLVPTLGSGVINVTAGSAWVDGHYCELTSPASESSTANGLLVVRFTPADNLFELVYRDGVSAPTQSDAVWELPIAQMVAGALTDVRSMIYTSRPSIVKARTQDMAGSGIASTASVELSATLNIPADWNTYDIEAFFQARLNETGTIAADRLLTNHLRLTGTGGTLLGSQPVLLGMTGPDNQMPLSINGFVTGQTTKGPVVVCYVASIAADSGQVSWDFGTLIATAFRTG